MRPSRVLVVMLSAVDVLCSLAGAGVAQTVTTLLNFAGTNGQFPVNVTLAQGRDGNLYGTTTGDGVSSFGSIFRIKPKGGGSTLYKFTGSEGNAPTGGLTLASNGNFYGTAGAGGTFGQGILFRGTPQGQLSVLYNFSGQADGGVPLSAPIEGLDGNLYGTTVTSEGGTGAGTIYKFSQSGTLTTIYSFTQNNGSFPLGLIQGTDGFLYASLAVGGAFGDGSYLKISTSGILKDIYILKPSASGPSGPLLEGMDGNLYGGLDFGGTYHLGLVGSLNGSTNVLSFLYSFGADRADGIGVNGGLVQASDTNLYGVTTGGGQEFVGVIFQLMLSGSYTPLYSFVPSQLSSGVLANTLKQHTSGKLYGTTELGGTHGLGSVYSLDMGLGPFVAMQKYQGTVGSKTQILGQGFTGATSVSYNGVPATSFSVLSDTYMTAVVPAGASSGSIAVTTPSGILTSDKIFVVKN